MSPETLTLLLELLGSVQLPVSHPEFAERAQQLITAKAELLAAIEATAESVDLPHP